MSWQLRIQKHVVEVLAEHFKFNASDAMKLLTKGKTNGNNETIGQSAEHALCCIRKIECNIGAERIDAKISEKIQQVLAPYAEKAPLNEVIRAIGEKNGAVDFEMTENRTLSLKTLKRSDGKICPQTVGQPSLKAWDTYWGFGDFAGKLEKNPERFNFIKENIHRYLNVMLENTFCCDHLVLISNCDKEPKVEFLSKPTKMPYFMDQVIQFSPGRDVYNEPWNEKKQKNSEFSTNVYIGEERIPVGEFQFHKSSRQVLKFRFYRKFFRSF